MMIALGLLAIVPPSTALGDQAPAEMLKKIAVGKTEQEVTFTGHNPEKEPVDCVNTTIGTIIGTIMRGGGNTYPGVCVPFGMTEWTPQTTTGAGKVTWRRGCPYDYRDKAIQGFRGTHYPSGACMGEYGSVTLMPSTGDLLVDPKKRASKFSHDMEIATPYYYAVTLNDYEIRVEFTATTRSGFFRFTFPASESSSILIDVRSTVLIDKYPSGGYIKIIPDENEIVGYNPQGGRSFPPQNFAGYFVAKFDKPLSSYGTWKGKAIHQGSLEQKSDQRVGAFANFSTQKGEVIKVKVGTSFISMEQARKNLNDEIPDWDFKHIKNQTRDIWNEELKKVEVKGGTEEQKVIFYTALYHSLLLPRVFYENGHYYSPFDGKVHEGVYYEDFSLWDTFRAEHPLLILIEPERNRDMIKSLVAMYEEGGWLPKWPNPGYSNVMIGTHADSVIADAYVKGITDFDAEKAYEAMYKNAMVSSQDFYEARGGVSHYKNFGYTPMDKKVMEGRICRRDGIDRGSQVSRTLEFAYDDFCIAQMARALGKDDDYDLLMKRAGYYKNLFDPSTKFMRGKNSDGSWNKPFVPWSGNGFTEGNAWQYTFFVPHDVQGLINLMGGREAFIHKLDTVFQNGQYEHENEPSHHLAYLYDYAGAPWKTQQRVREVMDELYRATPGGLCGNDDCGQMSAWYIFSAMGFYPVCPGTPYYAIGSPTFEKVVIHLGEYWDNKSFTIIAKNNSPENKYIQSATLNSKPLNKPWIEHSDIVNGGTLVFEMGPEPDKGWGSSPEHAPPSMTEL